MSKPCTPTPRRHRSVGWWLTFGLALFVLGWSVLRDDESPPAESLQPGDRSEPARDAPRLVEVTVASVERDAGPLVVVVNAGDQRSRADAGDERLGAEDILRRWREALAPLLRPDPRNAGKPAPVIAARGEGRESTADAGARPSCGSNVERFSLGSAGAADIVIAIDTSGSMYPELRHIAAWLTEVELAMRRQSVDFQMLVVADHTPLRMALQRYSPGGSAPDAGTIQARIGSRDALERLIASAREGPPPRWPELLRARSAKHVVIVTDDEAIDESGASYLAPLTAAAGGLFGSPENPAFALHLLGGFEPVLTGEVLGPDKPLAPLTGRGGVAPGLAYQRLAQITGGLRASLCYEPSQRALARALGEWPDSKVTAPCVWLLRPEVDGQRIDEVRAVGAGGSSRLWEVMSARFCSGRSNAYIRSGQMFALCSDSCEHLREEGYETVTLSTRCEE